MTGGRNAVMAKLAGSSAQQKTRNGGCMISLQVIKLHLQDRLHISCRSEEQTWLHHLSLQIQKANTPHMKFHRNALARKVRRRMQLVHGSMCQTGLEPRHSFLCSQSSQMLTQMKSFQIQLKRAASLLFSLAVTKTKVTGDGTAQAIGSTTGLPGGKSWHISKTWVT